MDGLNCVPDEIVCHILSFLSTKEAALTSILSKRWQNLYAFTPYLHLDDFDYQNPNSFTSFRDFVDRIILVSGNLPLEKFTLKHRDSVDVARINRWICNVLSRGVLDLNLFLTGNFTYSLPLDVFSCKTLVNLRLGMGFCIAMVPENASLPALKTLVLDHIRVSNSFEALLSACHVLEELTIRFADCEHWKKCFTVSSPTLKRLIIIFTCHSRTIITFDTPNLVYLDYCGSSRNEYPFVDLDSLVEVKLSLDSQIFCSSWNPKNLFNGFRNVQILELSSFDTSATFYNFRTEIPVMMNLMRLTIRTHQELCCPSLQFLLENSPNLQTLHLKGPLHFKYCRHSPNPLCVCQSSGFSFLDSCHVEVLEITEYTGDTGELLKMEYFLRKLQCLELVKVCASETYHKNELELTNDLLSLPRPYKCKIQFEFIPSELVAAVGT